MILKYQEYHNGMVICTKKEKVTHHQQIYFPPVNRLITPDTRMTTKFDVIRIRSQREKLKNLDSCLIRNELFDYQNIKISKSKEELHILLPLSISMSNFRAY